MTDRSATSRPAGPPAGLAGRLAAFLLVGGIATAVQYALLALLVELGHWRPAAASGLGFAAAACVNYWLNYHVTFGAPGSHGRAVARFAMVAGVGLALNTLVMVSLARVPVVHYLLAQVLATGLALAWNFTASHLWAFRSASGGARA